jgi:hypothetical protein
VADNLRKSGGQDRKRIDVSQKLRDWAKKFGVSAERLQEAVKAVGTQADQVQAYLISGADRKPAKRAGEHPA